MRWPILEPSHNRRDVFSITAMRSYLSQGTQVPNWTSIGSASWPAANRAIYLPFALDGPMPATGFRIANGTAAVAGSWDVGIYSADGRRLASTGTVAQTGVDAVQTITLGSPILLGRGNFWLAIMETSASASIYRVNAGAANDWLMWGALQEATGGSLPATATFASNTTAFLPYVSIMSELA